MLIRPRGFAEGVWLGYISAISRVARPKVYRSACHMADTTYWYMYLATPTDEQIHEFILNQFEVLWREYAAARALVPAGNLVEISYAELTAEPVRVGLGVGVGVAQP